jgi:hypothetical protein
MDNKNAFDSVIPAICAALFSVMLLGFGLVLLGLLLRYWSLAFLFGFHLL